MTLSAAQQKTLNRLPPQILSGSKWKRSLLTMVSSLALLSFPLSSEAVQLANGTVYFDSVPRFQKAATTISSTYAYGATYYFHLTVPDNAGESLKHISIQQAEGLDHVDFNLRRSQAYLHKRRGPNIPIQESIVDETGKLTITFSEPVAPGNDVVLALKPYRNPDTGGVYLFGVSAIPDGNKAHSQFLGYGRLHFYERSPFHSHYWW